MDIDSTEQATASCSWPVNGLSVERVAVANLPTTFGEFKIAGYRSLLSDEEFVVLFKSEMEKGDAHSRAYPLTVLDGGCLRLDIMRLWISAP